MVARALNLVGIIKIHNEVLIVVEWIEASHKISCTYINRQHRRSPNIKVSSFVIRVDTIKRVLERMEWGPICRPRGVIPVA